MRARPRSFSPASASTYPEGRPARSSRAGGARRGRPRKPAPLRRMGLPPATGPGPAGWPPGRTAPPSGGHGRRPRGQGRRPRRWRARARSRSPACRHSMASPDKATARKPGGPSPLRPSAASRQAIPSRSRPRGEPESEQRFDHPQLPGHVPGVGQSDECGPEVGILLLQPVEPRAHHPRFVDLRPGPRGKGEEVGRVAPAAPRPLRPRSRRRSNANSRTVSSNPNLTA